MTSASTISGFSLTLRYSNGSQVYRLYNPTTKKAVSSRDVKFDESTFPGLKDENGHEIFTLLPIQEGNRGQTLDQNVEPWTSEQHEAEDQPHEQETFEQQ
ncbi:hypothetical protein O6H91_07G013200 [Diphasiastrum complanatum]|uniref:Uncharacterized protein n=1 Tax=Diphasiastrum complanatum TaxID=34168 RepID=A0ACC2D2H6_DIPCM|nr:hypothetical protein O6H91_07G013200 [Diphasiastrum complanatum]